MTDPINDGTTELVLALLFLATMVIAAIVFPQPHNDNNYSDSITCQDFQAFGVRVDNYRGIFTVQYPDRHSVDVTGNCVARYNVSK